MKKILFSFAIVANVAACAQTVNSTFSVKEVERIETTLASDEMRGRKAGTPDIDKAAGFIADEFKKAGLEPVKGSSYLQDFMMVRPRFKDVKGEMDDQELNSKSIIVITMEPELKVDEKSGYDLQYVKKGDNGAAKKLRSFCGYQFQSNISKVDGSQKICVQIK
jgi:hypothetical protein